MFYIVVIDNSTKRDDKIIEIEEEMKIGWMKMNEVEVDIWMALHFYPSQQVKRPVDNKGKPILPKSFYDLFKSSFKDDDADVNSIQLIMTDIANAFYYSKE